MKKHVELWIEAYLDGELNPNQQRKLEKHLENCPECLQMIAERQALSSLLQDHPLRAELKSAERFTSEINLQLPRRVKRTAISTTENNTPSFSWQHIWQVLPILLLLAFIFIQTVGIASNILRVVPGANTLAEQSANLSSVVALPTFAEFNLGRALQFILDITGISNLLGWNILTQIIGIILIGILYSSWLAGWIVKEKESQQHNTRNAIEKGVIS
ncbi:MAG: zf-HC2 domain-containing protein [Anaerolineaceae bacterium]|nr:zf-HC2 domain-containing protein [Anaerolineaceae bacterium]